MTFSCWTCPIKHAFEYSILVGFWGRGGCLFLVILCQPFHFLILACHVQRLWHIQGKCGSWGMMNPQKKEQVNQGISSFFKFSSTFSIAFLYKASLLQLYGPKMCCTALPYIYVSCGVIVCCWGSTPATHKKYFGYSENHWETWTIGRNCLSLLFFLVWKLHIHHQPKDGSSFISSKAQKDGSLFVILKAQFPKRISERKKDWFQKKNFLFSFYLGKLVFVVIRDSCIVFCETTQGSPWPWFCDLSYTVDCLCLCFGKIRIFQSIWHGKEPGNTIRGPNWTSFSSHEKSRKRTNERDSQHETEGKLWQGFPYLSCRFHGGGQGGP